MNTAAASLSSALSAGRIALGLGLVAAPEPLGRRWIGRAAQHPGAQVMTRATGVRDAALGAATIGTLRATGTDGVGFRVLTALGVVVDLVDAASTWTAREHVPTATVSTAIAGGAAVSGLVVLALSGTGDSTEAAGGSDGA